MYWKRIASTLLLMLVPVICVAATVTHTGDPERFKSGNVEYGTRTSALPAPTPGNVRFWWLDQDEDDAYDAGDGLYYRLFGGAATLLAGGDPYTAWTLAGDSGSSQSVENGN